MGTQLSRLIRICAVLLGVTVYACSTQVMRPSQPFDLAATEQALRPGRCTITGQAFKKTAGGDVKYGAGNTIALYPLTSYFSEVLSLLPQANTFTRVEYDSKVWTYKKTTTANGEGRFKFTNLAPGRYYLGTTITWGVPTRYGVETTGGPATAIVNIVQDGETAEVILQ